MNITLVAKPDDQSRNILIDELPFLIGRDESPFAQFMQESQEMNKAVHHISRRHATIYEDEGKILIKDLGSKNGTNLNDKKLGADPAVIENGDSIRITKQFIYAVKIERERDTQEVPFSLTLLPADNQSGLDAIDVTTYPFDIGRKEESFLAYERTLPDEVASLSRKHARVTYRDNRIYMEDMGSTNGTTLSGEAIGNIPKPISNGDVVVFGQFFKYIVRLISEDVEETIALESETIREADRTIVVNTNKVNTAPTGAIASQGNDLMEDGAPGAPVKNVFYVQATRANTSPPDESPAPAAANLNGLSSLSESLDPFDESDEAGSVDESDEAGSTVYMSSATQFLKILTSDEKTGADEAETGDGTGAQPDAQTGGKERSRLVGLVKEIYSALSGTPSEIKRRKWYVAGALAAILGAALWWTVSSRMPEQRLKKMMAAEQYFEYLKLSDQVLAKQPNNEDIRRGANHALMRRSLPEFSDALKKDRIDAAKQIITSYGKHTKHNPDGQKSLGLLTWIAEIESYFAQNDPDKPINLFKDEAIIEPMVSRWDANEDEYRFIMDQMVQRSEAFEPIRSRAYHHLNVLKLKSVHLDAVKELNRNIQAKIDGARNDEILFAIDEYQRKHPKTEGLPELRTEAEHFQTLDQHIRARDVLKISAFLQQVQFQTPVFRQTVADLKKNTLPDPELGVKMTTAAQHWAQGNSDQALATLEGLAQERWGDLAEAKMDHYRRIMDLIARVNETKGTTEHSEHLIALRSILNPEEDQFYAQQVEADFVGLRDQELRKSQRLMDKAAKGWAEYLESGRITGLLRLESTVSQKFAQRAKLLKSCFEQSRSGEQIYNKLNMDLPDKWQQLNTRIADEVIAQRFRIEDLSGILGPEVATAKLALLPSP